MLPLSLPLAARTWFQFIYSVRVCSVAQPCLTLCDPMDRSPPGSSVYGILQARILSGLPFPPAIH